MVAIRIAQPANLGPHDAAAALGRFLANTYDGSVSTMTLPGQCRVRMLLRHDRTKHPACLLTWVPAGPGVCSFLGTMSIIQCGRGRPALILDGQVEVHDPAQLQDERLARTCAEAVGHAVLDRIAAALTPPVLHLAAPSRRMAARSDQRFMSNVSPMLHAARNKSARMG